MNTFASFFIRSHRALPIVIVFLWCLCIVSCANTGKPQLQIESYLIDYPATRFDNPVPIDDTIRVERFTIAGAYNTPQMIFRRDRYDIDSFNYNRWAVNPADMVGDILLRDLKESGLFRAAFSRYALDEGRYILQGGVEEFFLRIDQGRHTAVVNLDMTLKDVKQREAMKRILFQKKYRAEETLKSETPRGYCQAASLAMEQLSRRIIADVYQTIKTDSKKY